MTALTSPVSAPDPYMVSVIDDEMEIARLLGYRKLERPYAGNPSPNIWGIAADFKPEWPGAEGRSWLPKWRRSWTAAGELIARCELMISCTASSAVVSGPDCKIVHESFTHYPTPDDAIRAAMCKAAIAYLSKERGA